MIQVRELGKAYRLGAQASLDRTLPEAIGAGLRRLIGRGAAKATHADTFWALKDVSFDVAEGEVVGIIGHNGAGKSTLLKILSQITDPTCGEAILRGRVASLLEVGTGFHPELTGRENIFLNGAVLGMTRREIARKFDAIVDFSGVEPFLDTPVKRYSSGMTVRLAFAVAAHLEPEILIIDEVLAVGDAEFQRKCLGKMQDVAQNSGRTVLFVSHNMDSIMALSNKVLVMRHGQSDGIGNVEEGIERYFSLLNSNADGSLLERPRKFSDGRAPVFANLRIVDDRGDEGVIACGSSVTFEIDLVNMRQVNAAECGIIITNDQGARIVVLQSQYHANLTLRSTQDGCLRVTVPNLSLVPGTYHVDLNMVDNGRMMEYVEHAGSFNVVFADVLGTGRLPNARQGHIVLPSEWRLAA